MAVVRWSPLTELASLQSDMARMMDNAFGRSAGPGNGGATWLPPVDVTETEVAAHALFDQSSECEYRNDCENVNHPHKTGSEPKCIMTPSCLFESDAADDTHPILTQRPTAFTGHCAHSCQR